MALPILNTWKNYFTDSHEGLGSSYERIILNDLLLQLKKLYHINSVIEVPIFGFTGITGLNSIALYKAGCEVTLLDHDAERVGLVNNMLKAIHLDIKTQTVADYNILPFADNAFDLSWNFSALWFVDDLEVFLKELTRITQKVVLICVPNQTGLGYKWQKANSDIPHNIKFDESNIDPARIMDIMHKLNWKYKAGNYIDCPLWPDIGMSKEKFLGKYLSSLKLSKKEIKPKQNVSIIDYYSDKDPDFPNRMRKYSLLEKYAPTMFKKYWAHHHWYLFENPTYK
jgi:hypothetical protein